MADFIPVEVTDTFDQWRIKTNQLGTDFATIESGVAGAIANIDLSTKADTNHSHVIDNVTGLETKLETLVAVAAAHSVRIDGKVSLNANETIRGNKTFGQICVFESSLIAESGITISGDSDDDRLRLDSGKMQLRSQSYTWPDSYAGGRYLRTDSQGNLTWEEVAGGSGSVNLSTLVFNDIVPVGTIMPWAGVSLPADDKWKFCDGADISRITYSELFGLIGNRYGTANDNDDFTLPNLNGKVPIGAGAGFSVGNEGGDSTATIGGSTGSTLLNVDQIPSHKHLIATTGSDNTGILSSTNQLEHYYNYQESGSDQPNNPNFEYALHGSTNEANLGLTSATGEGEGHTHSLSGSISTLQPYLTTQYIIKVLPDDVQQVSITAGNGINVKNADGIDSNKIDLFSTALNVKVDTGQFKFSDSGLLQLKSLVQGPQGLAGADGADGADGLQGQNGAAGSSVSAVYNTVTRVLTITV